MCGVIGLRCARDRPDLGAKAAALLRMLEYRGYDSTGALLQSEDGRTTLRKDVGSPTVVTRRLAIGGLSGKLFCGQVRWATFGAVTRENAQPHEVRCKTHLYGAHNGNITNCSQLKDWLAQEGHRVVSDNDGEMLVHAVEHFFARELARRPAQARGDGAGVDAAAREAALKAALLQAARKLVGSYAAVVVDPVTQLMAAVKAGSSLYMGFGQDAGGPFILASSDLASVLSQTKVLAPIAEGELALYTHDRARFYDLRSGAELEKEPVRSRLKVEETELKAPFRYFMEQEIFAQPGAVRKVIALFLGRSPRLEASRRLLGREPALRRSLGEAVRRLSSMTDAGRLRQAFARFLGTAEWRRLRALAARGKGLAGKGFESSMGSLLEELAALGGPGALAGLRLLDGACLLDEADDVARRVAEIARLVLRARAAGRSVYLVACGTSFHAAKVASVFFNRVAGVRVSAMLPGDFRAECASSLRGGDVLIGISQSGETKDLIDVINLVRRGRAKAAVVTVVNNVNSTLALEKADLYLPLFCGPEIAVPATKSFMNQLAVLYILALKVAERTRPAREIRRRLESLLRVPELLERTLSRERASVRAVAKELFLAPSLHVLATGMQGVAREGALKIREVVLNHAEGYEGAEFKHGPNTILGVNTVFGLEAVLARPTANGRAHAGGAFLRRVYANYPLVFVTGPAERDIHLTISQINTHKIRGADIYVIAEEDAALRDAAARAQPARFGRRYRSGYVALPATGDELLPFFTSALVLQLLALEMSVLKRGRLERLGMPEHGVHPDSPKNVSKSITVD